MQGIRPGEEPVEMMCHESASLDGPLDFDVTCRGWRESMQEDEL